MNTLRPPYVLVLGCARQPSGVAAARSNNAATGAARQSHDPQACPLSGQHLQKVRVVFDQGAAEAAKLGHIDIIQARSIRICSSMP